MSRSPPPAVLLSVCYTVTLLVTRAMHTQIPASEIQWIVFVSHAYQEAAAAAASVLFVKAGKWGLGGHFVGEREEKRSCQRSGERGVINASAPSAWILAAVVRVPTAVLPMITCSSKGKFGFQRKQIYLHEVDLLTLFPSILYSAWDDH